jgi:uncharacterized protein (DUF362 family)
MFVVWLEGPVSGSVPPRATVVGADVVVAAIVDVVDVSGGAVVVVAFGSGMFARTKPATSPTPLSSQ